MAIVCKDAQFSRGKDWETFLAEMTENRERLLRVLDAVRPTREDIERARKVLSAHPHPLSVLVLTEDWCPDAIVNIPVLVRFVDTPPKAHVRFFYRSEHPDLQEAYAAEGVYSIPVFSFFDSEGREIARFVEQSPTVARRKAEWMARYPEAQRWRESNDPQERQKYHQLMARRFAAMIRWYEQGLWRATWDYLVELLTRPN